MHNLEKWVSESKQHLDLDQVQVIILANKIDLNPEFNSDKLLKLEKQINAKVYKTSAVTGSNIINCLHEAVHTILNLSSTPTCKGDIYNSILLNS